MNKGSRVLWIICWGAGAIGVVMMFGGLVMMATTLDIRWLFVIYSSPIAFSASVVFAVLASICQREEKNTATP